MNSIIRLTAKELARSSDGVTIVVRPQSSGGYKIMAVHTTGHLVDGGAKWTQRTVESQGGIHAACKEIARMLDKCGYSSDMTSAARSGHV